MAASASASASVQAAVLGAAQAVEAAVDAKIDALDAALRDGGNALNSGDDLAALRARRLTQLREDAEARAQWEQQGHGVLHHARGDKEFFDAVRGCSKVVACFARSSRPCDAMERLLTQLAPRHLEAKFIQVDAERCPFLAERMRITVLPTVAVLLEGRAEGYQVGFDGLPGGDGCGADALERRLVDLGGLRPEGVSVLSKAGGGGGGSVPSMEKHGSGMVRGGGRGAGKGRVAGVEDEDSDFD